jgi:hypothetical protein
VYFFVKDRIKMPHYLINFNSTTAVADCLSPLVSWSKKYWVNSGNYLQPVFSEVAERVLETHKKVGGEVAAALCQTVTLYPSLLLYSSFAHPILILYPRDFLPFWQIESVKVGGNDKPPIILST